MLAKSKHRIFTAVTLMALALVSAQVTIVNSSGDAGIFIAMAAAEEQTSELDKFSISKIFPTRNGGNEWYVNMEDPRSDSRFRNLNNVEFQRNSDGSWRVSADQIRMEAWSPANEKWLNVEITAYAKIESGSNELLQMYSRGGHHTSRDECLGSAYKARLYGDGRAAWNKEITHPAYAGNRGVVQATTEPLDNRWVGFKAVIYNFKDDDGQTYVRLESYIDNDVNDKNGNLVVKNDWEQASVVEDRGGWATNDSDFDPSCGRERDEILTSSGGTDSENIAAFRTDDLTWSFKYLSVREIDPISQSEPSSETDDSVTETTDGTTTDGTSDITIDSTASDTSQTTDSMQYFDDICDLDSSCELVAGQHVLLTTGPDMTVSSIDLTLRKLKTYTTTGYVCVAILQEGRLLAIDTIDVSRIDTSFDGVTAKFDQPITVTSDFDIIIYHAGSGEIVADNTSDKIAGNYFDEEGELSTMDLIFEIG